MGQDLTPNTLTEAAVQGLNLTRLQSPYPSKCMSNWSETNYTDYIDKDWSYNLLQCQRVCTHSSVLMDCGCFHPLFMDLDAAGETPCNLTDSCKILRVIHLPS